MRIYFLTLCFLLFSITGFSQTTIWLGGSSDWDDAANWSAGIPTTGFTATIPGTPQNGMNFPIYDVEPLTEIDYTIQIFGGSLTFNTIVYNTGTLINSGGGTIINNQTFINVGMVEFNNNDGTFINNGVVDNYGLFNNEGISTLTNTTGNTFNNYGEVDNFGLITNDGTFLNIGTLTSTSDIVNNGTLTNRGSLNSVFSSTLINNNGATFNNEAGAAFELNGAFTNAGTIVSDGSFFIQTVATTDNSGTITSNGTFDLSGSINNTGTFTNNNTMLINNSGQFENNNVFTNSGTLTLSICGELIQNAANNIAGTIINNGLVYEINGTVDVTNTLEFGSEFTDLSERQVPETKCNSGLEIFLDVNGNATLDANEFDNNSFGFCGATLVTKVLSQSTFTTADLGVQQITLTITDEFGFFSSCVNSVEVFPFVPVAVAIEDADIDMVCPTDIIVQVEPGSVATTINWNEPVPTTNCQTGNTSLTIQQISGKVNGSIFFIGEWQIAYEVTDNCGNQEICVFNVIVEDNPAEITLNNCPTNMVVDPAPGASSAQVFWTAPTATSDCFLSSETEVVQSSGPASGSILPIGISQITYIIGDSCGNFTSCFFIVTVNETPTTFNLSSCPSDLALETTIGQTSAVATWAAPTASTDCYTGTINVNQLVGPANGSVFSIGTTTVAYVISDDCGNTELCSFTVTVIEGFSCPAAGMTCDDGDATTENDVEDGNCNCAGTPIVLCPAAGTACDDNNATTENDIEDGDCNCAGTPIVLCPAAGTACDDNDATTENDIEDGDCNCAGTPIVLCPVAGTACDDNNATTENDIEDGNCNCAGTPCATTGTSCDDGDATTENDVEDGNCNCAGTPIVLCPAAGTACDDNNATTENDIEDGNCNCAGTPINTGGGCSTTTNLALNGTATESSAQSGGIGSRVIDGNINGNFWSGNSVALTNWEVQPWIEIDLGQVSNIESFNVYNRTDCCDEFLKDYHILVSDVPFTSTSLSATMAQAGVVDVFQNTIAAAPTTVAAPANTTGRYIRIQLEGTSFLGLAELEINGCIGTSGCPAAGMTCDDNNATTENDVEDGNCNCAGTPIVLCPAAGTACDDNNVTTENDVEDGNCNCAGTPINTGGGCTTTTNLALNGTASQVSTLYLSGFAGNADNAIDGNTNGIIFDGSPQNASVSGTTFTSEPWWEVDLGASYLIETVNVFNRTDGANRTKDAYILISNTPFTTNDLAGARAEADYELFVAGQVGTPSVAIPNIEGQYVRIQIEGTNYIVLAEVEVFGCASTGGCPIVGMACDDGDATTENDVEDGNCNCAGTPINNGEVCTTTTNLALNGTAFQASTLYLSGFAGNASNAIDGNTNGVIFDGTPQNASVSGTTFTSEPWWEVDLGASYLIETVNVFNRTDGVNRTNNVYILVSNTPFTANDLAGARAEADYELFVAGQVGTPSVAIPNIVGQYVRIQAQGTDYVVLAEVEVFGCATSQLFAIPNMLDFNVEKDGRTSKVDWVMLKDVNVDYYEVEVSTDGNEFRVLNVIEADRIASARNYNTVDANPIHGYNYYRLRVNNLDGSAYYSNTRRVNFDIDFGAVTVFPNPTNDYIHVSLKDFAGQSGTIEIYNSLGQQVEGNVYQSIPAVPATFDVSKMIGGIYTISIKVDGHRRFNKKFIISNL